MAVVANEDGDLMMQDPLSQEATIVSASGEQEHEEIEEITDDSMSPQKNSNSKQQNDSKLRKEMENCFGFDEVCFIFF